MRMKTIATTERFSLAVDPAKNRLYCTMRGVWKQVDDADAYLNYWRTAIHQLASHFTVLVDLCDLKIMSQEWVTLALEVERLVINAGILATAEVIAANPTVIMQANRISRETHLTKQVFADREQAEAWLDRLTENNEQSMEV